MRISIFLVPLILALSVLTVPVPSFAAVDVSVSLNLAAPPPPPPVAIAPPPLPVYVVPPPPAPSYIWTPGYWLWNGAGYFWVPGTWVMAPAPGLLWTPGYWGYVNGAFLWHEGYWGPHVGFYGGVNYGGGYVGVGFVGGGWSGGVYTVNRAFVNVNNVTIVAGGSYVSFNGGPGGATAAPTAQELAFANERHFPPSQAQFAHIVAAGKDPSLAASFNHGKPAIAATGKPGDFTHGVVAAKEAGPRNLAAEQHNIAIKKNPALAKDAALPKQAASPNRPAGQPRPGAARPTREENGGQAHRPQPSDEERHQPPD